MKYELEEASLNAIRGALEWAVAGYDLDRNEFTRMLKAKYEHALVLVNEALSSNQKDLHAQKEWDLNYVLNGLQDMQEYLMDINAKLHGIERQEYLTDINATLHEQLLKASELEIRLRQFKRLQEQHSRRPSETNDQVDATDSLCGMTIDMWFSKCVDIQQDAETPLTHLDATDSLCGYAVGLGRHWNPEHIEWQKSSAIQEAITKLLAAQQKQKWTDATLNILGEKYRAVGERHRLASSDINDPIALWFDRCVVVAPETNIQLSLNNAVDSLRGFVINRMHPSVTGEVWNPSLKELGWQKTSVIKQSIERNLGELSGAIRKHWIGASLNSVGWRCRMEGAEHRWQEITGGKPKGG